MKSSALPSDTPVKQYSSHNKSPEELAATLERIASILEMVEPPLMAYLEEKSSHADEPSHDGQSVDHLLAESPIAPFLKDDGITDILINGPYEIYVNRSEGLEKTDSRFENSNALRSLAKAIANAVGRFLDPKRPLVDARLKDGSRVNIIAPPMAIDGITLSIRKFPKQEITLEDLVEKKEMSPALAEFLALCAQCKVSLLISGGTGTGKTTLLNAISRFIPHQERIITIEDTAELRLQQPHVIRLETKSPQVLGAREEEVNASDLVRNALRMRPDRIIVGEVRAAEAYDMIQALNTGHAGSMSTVHANTPRDAFTRIENLMAPRLQNTAAGSIRRQIVSAINIVVQLVYTQDGKRIVESISEIVGMEGDIPTMQEIFKLQERRDDQGRIHYTHLWTQIIPHQPRLAEAMRASAAFAPSLEKMNSHLGATGQ